MQEYDLSEGQFYFAYALGQAFAILVILNGTYCLFYWLESPFIERYKCLEEPWPWNSEDKEGWNKLFWRTVKLYSLNVLVIGPLVYSPIVLFDLPIPFDMTLEGLPDANKMCLQIFFCILMEDLTFHCSHRMLHLKQIYPYIHKIHHEHKSTFCFAAQYAHPLEFVFGNLLPAAVGPLLFGNRIHFVTTFTWYIFRFVESAEAHSGYEFSWSPFRVLPFSSDYAYHAYHHSHNIGNYSSFFTVWDTVFGSNKVYYKQRKEIQAASEVAAADAMKKKVK